MRVYIVNCFDHNDPRVEVLQNYFEGKGHVVTVLTSNFSHILKQTKEDNGKYIYIKCLQYKKNISIARILSHILFGRKIYKILLLRQPDIVYMMFPPNILAYYGGKYKKKYPSSKLIFDVIDMWPESMPLRFLKKTYIYTMWKKMRDNNLKFADTIFTECCLYKTWLESGIKGLDAHVLWWVKKDTGIRITPELDEEKIHLCYLGSINNIIDISTISAVIKSIVLAKPVILHIIGDGEARERFISEVESAGAEVIYYGKVFDDRKKHEIFAKCHFGLNIMKDTVCVGLTIKSIDYFEAGLPIINNIKGDTWNLVLTENIGFNIDGQSNLAKAICSLNYEDNLQMRKRSRDLFVRLFSESAFMKKIDSLLENHKIA